MKLNWMNFGAALLCLIASSIPRASLAQNAKFTLLRTVSVHDLNQVLDHERDQFIKAEDSRPGPEYKKPPAPIATNAVDIYRVTYETTIPEQGNKRVLVSGLMALPRVADRSKIPLISYQHGTVYHKYGVPSYAFDAKSPLPYDHRPESFEDRYMVALFGGNGYGVIAADYIGFGVDSKSNEAYLIKGATSQASVDLYRDASDYLATQKIYPSNLFLAGWSQGAHNTTAVLQKLESQGVRIRAAFAAANPSDAFAPLNSVFFHPQSTDSKWFPAMIGQLAFSCEAFVGPKGLAKSTLNPDYYEDLLAIYLRKSGYPEILRTNVLTAWATKPKIEFIKKELRDPATFAASDFGRCLAANEAFRQEIKTNMRMYYGTDDEIVRERIGRLGSDYQLVLKGAPEAPTQGNVMAIPIEGGTHRLTFLNGSVDAKAWMDGMR